MSSWQADFYHYGVSSLPGEELWHLTLCDRLGNLLYTQTCPQREVSSHWLKIHLQTLGQRMPVEEIQIFRPQILNLFSLALEDLEISLIPTRRTLGLKTYLKEHYGDGALHIDSPPPQPLPESLWGEQWRFAALPASDLMTVFQDYPIPYLDFPEDLWPVNRGIASDRLIPGVIIYAGRQARYLGQWLASIGPVSLHYQALDLNEAGGLVLEAGLSDRWIMATFNDGEMATNAQTFMNRQMEAQGLHFLLVQPDDSGMTTTGVWLLQHLAP
ncbi:MAG: Tab2/Atab2 family RNA-binding protein [Merismopediaceae bacterium]|nr:Tab2/Atab2 family RNA-binding protein [Merismopediaceae bacterium]